MLHNFTELRGQTMSRVSSPGIRFKKVYFQYTERYFCPAMSMCRMGKHMNKNCVHKFKNDC